MTGLIGQRLGQYQIVEELGRGGMAQVFLAVQPKIGREVAIKILPSYFLQDQTFLERFSREVRIAAALQHPHILPIYDFGEQEDMPYIVMAYLTGGTLEDLIRRSGRGLSNDVVLHLLGQIVGALDFAHSRGIIHRDFKPSNILLDENGNAYLSDFGIARATEETAQLTGSGMVGTPSYMAPEMSVKGGTSYLIDIYALGVTIFQMLTGELPYQADTPIGVLMAHMNHPVPDVHALRPDLPPGVQAVLEQAMAKDPAGRFQSARELLDALQDALSGVGAPLPPEPPAAEYQTIGIPEESFQIEPHPVVEERPTPAPRKRSRGWVLALGGVVGIVIVGCIAVLGLYRLGVFGQTNLPALAGDGQDTATPSPTELVRSPTLTSVPDTPTSTASVTPEPSPTPNTTPTPANNGAILFADDFDAIGDLDQGDRHSYIEGEYEIRQDISEGSSRSWHSTDIPVETGSEFVVEFDVRLVEQAEYGAAGFRFGDNDAGFYDVFVNGLGELDVTYWERDPQSSTIENTDLISGQTHAAILGGTGQNHIRAEVDGTAFRILINYELVAEITLPSVPEGKMGLNVMAYRVDEQPAGDFTASARFDNLVVRAYAGASAQPAPGGTATPTITPSPTETPSVTPTP